MCNLTKLVNFLAVAMANIARHVIANEYSEEAHDNTSRLPSTISEDTREDSPLSTSSGPEHVETPMVRTLKVKELWGAKCK